jgi:hypothetical protein
MGPLKDLLDQDELTGTKPWYNLKSNQLTILNAATAGAKKGPSVPFKDTLDKGTTPDYSDAPTQLPTYSTRKGFPNEYNDAKYDEKGKVVAGKEHSKQRPPSWTDRVLFAADVGDLQPGSLKTLHKITLSDHIPASCKFEC